MNIFDKFGYHIICNEPLYYNKNYKKENVSVTFDLSDIQNPIVHIDDDKIDQFQLRRTIFNCEREEEDFDYETLLEWIESQISDEYEPGFGDTSDDEEINDIVKVKSNPNRKLTIYTWGKAYRNRAPSESQRNFNASVLNGKRKGVNLKKLDGRSEDVQKVVESGTRFWSWANSVVKNIEDNDLNVISVNCTKGRHRSVAGSILLKKYFYPSAKIIHVELKSIS